MKNIVMAILISIIPLLSAVAIADVQKLNGKDSARSPEFTVNRPWTMDWSARSEFPLLASIELRLYDSTSGDFVGMIAEVKGTGSGLKLMERTGTFRIVVVGTFVEWDIEIEEISDEQAASLKRSAEDRLSLIDSARQVSRLVPEGSFTSWRPQGNERLLLFDDDGVGWRVTFSKACPGLENAKALSFVTAADDVDMQQYDSILLEDGIRCYFDKAIPSYVKP